MKNILLFLFLLKTVFSVSGQIIYKDSVAPKIEFTNWIDNPRGNLVIKDKPVVLEFWSTWCGPCIQSIPHFNKLTEKYKKEITFISVNSYETKEVVEKFLTKKNMLSFVSLDENKSLKNAFNIQSIPVTIIIDKKGMIRWRGIASELTDDLLNNFISQNKFKNNHKKGVLLDKEFSINSLENVNYQLVIEFGDATLGKGISIKSKGEFYLKISNNNLYNILNTFSDSFGLDENWKFEGNPSDRSTINLTIKSQIELDKSDTKGLLKDVIFRLSEYFKFKITPREEIQTIWYITTDPIRLEKYISKDQNLDIKVIERTENTTKFQNLYFDYLASVYSIMTKEKVEYNQLVAPKKYDLTILISKDIQEIGNYLKEKYGIKLVKKKEKVKVKIVTFY